MLLLIGLGLDAKDLSVKALDALRSADLVLMEDYTTFLPVGYLEYLKAETKSEIAIVRRSDLEDNVKKTVAQAEEKTVAILVPGDPLIATTHHIILDESKRQGIEYRVYHSASIFSAAIGESGLDVYRFGPPFTIPFWSENYKPTSFVESLKRNMENDQHSLILLDLDAKSRSFMTLAQAVQLLRDADWEKRLDIVTEDLCILAMGDVGKSTCTAAYLMIKNIARVEDRFKGKPIVIIVPASPSPAELESISRFLVK
jgi:diphthine synthase